LRQEHSIHSFIQWPTVAAIMDSRSPNPPVAPVGLTLLSDPAGAVIECVKTVDLMPDTNLNQYSICSWPSRAPAENLDVTFEAHSEILCACSASFESLQERQDSSPKPLSIVVEAQTL